MILKKLKITVEQKLFQWSWQEKEKRQFFNFRQTSKRFSIKNGQLYYKESRITIAGKDRLVDIIHDISLSGESPN